MIAKKVSLLLLFMALFGRVVAYEDHRGVQVDSLENILSASHPPQGEELMRIYLQLMRGYESLDNGRCVHYAKEALSLSYKINALKSRESAFYNLGLMAYGRDEWDLAAEYFYKALAVTDSMRSDRRYSEADIDDNLSQLYGALGNLYNIQDKLLLAVEYYQLALPIFERNGWIQSQCILHNNVGELYLSMGNLEKAKEHYLAAILKGEECGDSLMIAMPSKGLAKLYIAEGDRERGQKAINEAYVYFHAHRQEQSSDYPEVLASMARLNLMGEPQDLEAAQAYVDEALGYIQGEMMSETRHDIFAAACEVAMAQKRWKQALDYGLQSVRPDSVASYNDASCYVLLAQIYMELGNNELARQYIHKVFNTMEQFSTEHYQSGLSQMEVLYETDAKQAAIDQLQQQKKLMTWGILLGTLVLLLTIFLFFLLWRSVRLNRMSSLMRAKLDGEVEERIRIARDLHDRLGGTLTTMKIKVDQIASLQSVSLPQQPVANLATVKEMTVLQTLTNTAIHEMRNVAHHLLPDSLRRYGLRTALHDYCQTMPHVRFTFMGEEHHLEQEEVIYCIVYELVNNAVKSAEAEHIDVQLIAGEEQIVIVVCDDGNGLLDPDTLASGMGINNIRQRLAAIGGRINFDSQPGKGTEIHIEIDKNL